MIDGRPLSRAPFGHPCGVMGTALGCAINAVMSTIGRMRE